MEGGGFGTVTEIHEDNMRVRHLEGMQYRHHLDGRFWNSRSSAYDLLPAIEPAKEGFSGPTIGALKAQRQFWERFHERISRGDMNPTAGDPYWGSGCYYIPGDYKSREAALSEAAAVIADLDALLEGRAGL